MRIRTVALLVTAIFLCGSSAALADDRDYRGRGDHVRDGDGWRLGERTRDGYAIYRRSGRSWYRVPGSGIDIADGWVLGSKRERGGYAIYRWNGRGWDQAPGGAVEIGGSYRRPWVVNNRGQRFTWNGYDWEASYGYGHERGDRRRYDRDRRHRFDRRERGRDFRRHFRFRDQDESRYRRNSRW